MTLLSSHWGMERSYEDRTIACRLKLHSTHLCSSSVFSPLSSFSLVTANSSFFEEDARAEDRYSLSLARVTKAFFRASLSVIPLVVEDGKLVSKLPKLKAWTFSVQKLKRLLETYLSDGRRVSSIIQWYFVLTLHLRVNYATKLTCTEKSASIGLDTLMFTNSPTTFTLSVIVRAGFNAVSKGLALETPPIRPRAVGVLRERAKNISWQQMRMAWGGKWTLT